MPRFFPRCRAARRSGTSIRTDLLRSRSMRGAPTRCWGWGSAPRSRSWAESSGRRGHHLDAGRYGDRRPPSLAAMQQPHAAGHGDKDTEHDEAERAGEVAEHGAEGMAEEIADADKARRPDPSGDEVQPQEAVPADRTHPQRKGREIAHAIDEPERQDEAGIVAFEPMERRVDAVAPARKAVEQSSAEPAAEPEIALVAAEAAEPCRGEQQDRIDQPLGRGEAGEQNDCLAFEKGPDEDDGIEAGAVMGNELIDVHRRPFPPCLPAQRVLCATPALAAEKRGMLRCSSIPVEPIPCDLTSRAYGSIPRDIVSTTRLSAEERQWKGTKLPSASTSRKKARPMRPR